ncbi:MAG: hypothetical protein EBR82_20695 [Caulobacteraceae bacterium]|nr:hypothetical protein [Caulobacteraceae bacterium]
MANPFSLIVAGVDGGANLLDLPAPSATTTPYVDLATFSLTLSGDGGGQMTFDVIQPTTPGGGPWWKSGGVYDNARVQFFDSRYSASTPVFLGFVTGVSAVLLPNGLGTRATVSVADADAWLDKTIVRKGFVGSNIKQMVGPFSRGNSTTTDRDHINAILAKVYTQVGDATTRQLLDTSIISGSARAVYTGSAVTIKRQTFKPTSLTSALDQIAEEASGVSGLVYRYSVDGDGRINYGPVTAAPAYANAPLEIVTDPASVAVGSASAASKMLSRSFTVGIDHDQIVKGIFVQAANTRARWDKNTPMTNDPYFRTYDGGTPYIGSGLASRNGPEAHSIFSAPKVKGAASRTTKIQLLTKATFQARSLPIRTVNFTIAGSDLSQTASPDWTYGYTQGYAQTAASTWTLVKAWLPNQYVKLTSAALDLSGTILRIASVTMSFESDSTYQVRYDIEAEYRRKRMGKALKRILVGE